jgi:copper chaperone
MTNLSVPEMSCGHCKASIEKAVISVDANARISVDLDNRIVNIKRILGDADLISALKEGGYGSSVV